MTDLATAHADTSHLHPFDGRDVLRTTIAITHAGDGLSEALAVDPRELHHGERVHVVLECVVTKVTFAPIKGTDVLVRIHTLSAGQATMVDEDLVREHLAEQADRIALAREKATGVSRLPYGEDEGGYYDVEADPSPNGSQP